MRGLPDVVGGVHRQLLKAGLMACRCKASQMPLEACAWRLLKAVCRCEASLLLLEACARRLV